VLLLVVTMFLGLLVGAQAHAAQHTKPRPLVSTKSGEQVTGKLSGAIRKISPKTPDSVAMSRDKKRARTPKPAPTVTPQPTTPPVTGNRPLPEFGTQFHGMWSSYTDTKRAMVLDTLKAHGVTTVRLDVSWAMLQPKGPGVFDKWGDSLVTKVLTQITERGLDPMVMIWMTPQWVTGSDDERVPPTTPAQLAHWEQFTTQAASRYSGLVRDWEVWNEPNHNDFMRGASATVYAKVLTAASRGLKAGNPAARVIFAGTQYVDVPWIEESLRAGAKGSYDVMGVHPYMAVGDAAPGLADNNSIWRMRHVPALRTLMLRLGDDKPNWFTEFGWRVGSTGTQNWQLGVSSATQAQYLAQTLKIVQEEWDYVKRVYWYRDLADSNNDDASGYGLILPDGTPKPALTQIPALYS
jgi:hypothetical protein